MSCGNGCGCCPKCGCKAACSCGKNNEPLFLVESASNSWAVPATSQAPSGDSAPEFSCAPAAENQLCDCGKQKICDCK